MNTLKLRRRLIYIAAIVALLVPLYFLGHPSVRDDEGEIVREGGNLAQIRSNYDLSHSDLGELDPASESARLATLGLRGVAATILWQRAEYYKREKYYDRLAATVNQLRILQPHFVKVWGFQAHNLAWNVSVEFDDYRQRYAWVKKGIHFLIDGSKFNKTRTEMPFELGWAFGNKLGMSDERVQFRELYRNDRNFHNEVLDRSKLDLTQQAGQGPDGKPDNWRGGALWSQRAYDMVDAGYKPARTPLMFYSQGAQWQYKHASAIQDEGHLGEEARNAWRQAGTAWRNYGQRQIRTSFGSTIFLNELTSAREKRDQLQQELYQHAGETYQAAYQKQRQQLTPLQLAALDKDPASLTMQELTAVETARTALTVSTSELIDALPADKRPRALELANQLKLAATHVEHIDRYRNQVNYAYWEARCVAEQDDAALAARRSMFDAQQLLDLGKLQECLERYEDSWRSWNALFNRFPAVMVDDTAEEVELAAQRYLQLRDLPEPPQDFPLTKFLRFRQIYRDAQGDKTTLVNIIADWPKRFPGRNFLDDLIPDSSAAITADPQPESETQPEPESQLDSEEPAAPETEVTAAEPA
ncbi:MAG: hypothetical protein KF752_09080 [Pirellulaceae bacterium]|nr:hypothetical protein [Pirellulaceae bacterium]